MRRICFDIGSSYFWNGKKGFLNHPSQARDAFENEPFKFYAATTFDSSLRKFQDFTDVKKLFARLEKADEIITFNGRTCDLIVMEKLLGYETMKTIWCKPHHDLRGWRMNFALKNAVRELLPDMVSSFDNVEQERLQDIRASSIKSTFDPEFIISHLANTYRDTKFTYALFLEYLKSGNQEYTFREDWAS